MMAGDGCHDIPVRRFLNCPDNPRPTGGDIIRNARKDAALPPEQRHGRAWRELFQFLKPMLVHADD